MSVFANLFSIPTPEACAIDTQPPSNIIAIIGFVDDIEEKEGAYSLKIYDTRDALRNPFEFIDLSSGQKFI
jgi:hypothetical protein